MTPPRPSVVFVLGMERRSGTHLLLRLVALHPAAVVRPGLPEDFLLRQAAPLRAYVDGLRDAWPTAWRVDPRAEEQILRRLGDGLLGWLGRPVPAASVVVTRSPSVDNLALAPALWPGATFLILVRDGRALVESGVRSFDWSYAAAARRWAHAARTVLAFDEAHRGGPVRYRIVRFEDLASIDVPGIKDLVAFCGLDPDALDDEQWKQRLADLAVVGSSESRAVHGRVSWLPQDLGAAFAPTRRFEDWSTSRRGQFAGIAGDAQRALGYPLDDVPSPGLPARAVMLWGDRGRWARRTWRSIAVRRGWRA